MSGEDDYCCACLGCDDHRHTCSRSDAERQESRRKHDEMIETMLTRGAGRHRMSDGSDCVVYRGPGDPEYPVGDGFDRPFVSGR